ncbi:uncharacterized protein [Temnothorax longispinosus]|uniref:uncharacterized protein isoform X2 n=1 Tax=Temnothorax longispinosus TaxID=300112 RepID=UPI003A98EACF
MADGVQKADAEMSQEAIKRDLLDLWTYLKIAFDLDGVHKGERVTLNVEDESLLINTELGANYRSEKRMLSDRLWKSLLIWREDKLLNDLPLEMPRTPSECHPATGEASVEKSEKRDKEGVDGEIGEFGDGEIGQFGKGEIGEFGKEVMVSLLANMAMVAEVAKEGKTLPMIVGNEIIVSDPKTSDYLKRIKDSIKPNPPVSKKTLLEDSEINELPALTKVRMQETKISEMTSVLSKFCTTTTKTMEQFGASLLQLNQLIKIMREEWGTQITRLDNVVGKLVTTYNLVDIEDEGEYEVNDKRKQTEYVATGDNESLESKISSAVKEQLENLRREDLTHSKDKADNSLINTVKDTLKLEFINKGANMRRDYKLNLNMKYEHFYDYFSSELRTCNLLHIIDNSIISNIQDESVLNEQKFKVRDILINHIDSYYHAKIVHMQNPGEILNKIKEIKRCEINVTSHSVRKQLYNMKYIIGKTKASEFCEKFEEIIRNYENSPGATPLFENEKRDAFYNAVMISVPQIQSIEFVTKNSNGASLSYDQLKLLVMQDEAARNQVRGGQNQVRTANLANLENVRCYECQGYGHIGAKCPRRGLSGRQCYNCGEFGDHRAAECPNSPKKFNQQKGGYRYNNVRSRGRGINQRRGLKRKAEYNGKSENAKRGKYNGPRGKGRNNYKTTNNRCDKGGNKGNNSDQGTQQNGGNSTEKTNNHKGNK